MSELSHLDQLEAEAIYIIREVAASCEKPVMLYSIGKDSSVMLHLALKAFYPEKPPFPFLHVNTTWKFKEMIKFRDETAKKYGLEMIEYINEDGVKQGVNPLMKKNLVQKKESSLLEMKIRHGIQRTRDQKCGNYITLRSKKEKAFVYSQSLTGQRQISGNISNAKKSISFHYILQKNAQ